MDTVTHKTNTSAKRAATIIELVIAVLTCIGLVVAAWVNINSRVAILETETRNGREQMNEIKSDLKEIKHTTTTILLQLSNKADKK
jgi:hypothetical protein